MSIALSLNEYQYEAAKKKLAETEGCTLTENHIQTPWIDADFEYVAEANTLKFTNEHKHGLTTFVSDKTIAEHIMSLLGNLPTEAPEAPSEPQPDAPKEN